MWFRLALAVLCGALSVAQASEFGGNYVRAPNGEKFSVCGGSATVAVNTTGGALLYDISLGKCDIGGLPFVQNGTMFRWNGEEKCGDVVFTEASFFKYEKSMYNTTFSSHGVELRDGWDYLEIGTGINNCLYYAKLSLSVLDWLVPLIILAAIALCVGCCCLSARLRKGSTPRPPPGASVDSAFDTA